MPKSVDRWVTNRPISTKLPGSSKRSRRSRAVSLPASCCLTMRSGPPPTRARAFISSRRCIGEGGGLAGIGERVYAIVPGDLDPCAVAYQNGALCVVPKGSGGKCESSCFSLRAGLADSPEHRLHDDFRRLYGRDRVGRGRGRCDRAERGGGDARRQPPRREPFARREGVRANRRCERARSRGGIGRRDRRRGARRGRRGGSCSPRDCQNGTWACVDGGRVCQETTAFDAGTPCGVGGDGGASVCNAGQCVACNAGGDCSDPSAKCVKKTYDCSSGTGVCKVNGNAPDGTSCGMALYCAAGACAPCLVGTSCQPASNACHAGKITACTAGIQTCSDLGMAAGASTSCSAAGGGSGVRDGNGSSGSPPPGAS